MNVKESIICAGFGGQGVMVLGKYLANVGMASGFNITWLPSYGAEVRGGTAHSYVRISTDEIANPMIFEPSSAIIMNTPSLDKFEKKIKSKGLLILNTSLCEKRVERKDIDVVDVPLTEEAIRLGNVKIANIIAAGIYAGKKGIFDKKILLDTLGSMAGKRAKLIPINIKAVERGLDLADSK